MKKTILIAILGLLCHFATLPAQAPQKSELQQRAESEMGSGKVASARFFFIRAFEDYAGKKQMEQAVECGTKGAALYYQKENYYKEAFDLLRRIDQTVAEANLGSTANARLRYMTAKERMLIYMKLRRSESVKEQLNAMQAHANTANDEKLTDDLLYNKAIYYYSFGQNEKGNAAFRQMAGRLTAQKEYGKVEEVYKTLIAAGLKSGSANMVAQSYSNYMAWKDSVNEVKRTDETGALKKQIATHEATIEEQQETLTTRWMTIVGLAILAAALVAVLAGGAVVLLRYIVLSRKQKKTIKVANESNALKAKFISNISAQIEPTLNRLDEKKPEVAALRRFSQHIQTLSELEGSAEEKVEKEEVQVLPFCETLMDRFGSKAKGSVNIKMNVPKMVAVFNKDYVQHILLHLLGNAVKHTPEGGSVTLDFKKRGPHKYQFIVTDTGTGIPAGKQEDVFKPFLEIKDLTEGDGLGLPICKRMAMKMDGDIAIDPEYTKGARFVLDLYS